VLLAAAELYREARALERKVDATIQEIEANWRIREKGCRLRVLQLLLRPLPAEALSLALHLGTRSTSSS
jgi:hypothetical protein